MILLQSPSIPADNPKQEPRNITNLTFQQVYTQYLNTVWRVLRSLGIREADLEDCCQDVFMVVLRKLPEYNGSCAVTTWLYSIAVRTALSYRRRAYNRREEQTDDFSHMVDQANTQEKLENAQSFEVLLAILNQLDDDRRAVFVLYEIEEQTMNEIAQVLDCPLQTAYSRLHSARKFVQSAVQRIQARSIKR